MKGNVYSFIQAALAREVASLEANIESLRGQVAILETHNPDAAEEMLPQLVKFEAALTALKASTQNWE